MTYEVKFRLTHKSGKVITENVIATAIEFGKREGLDAIKVLPEGKNRWKWFEIPNDYQMNTYYDNWSLTIAEATTGKNVYKVER